MKLRDYAAAVYLPLVLSVFAPSHQRAFEATLNQDGSWSITGDIDSVKGLSWDAQFRCILAELQNQRPASNPNADNTSPMTFERMKAVICADPIAAPCACPAAVS